MMKQLDYLLNSKELGLNRHNIGVIASGYGFEGVPFKEILEQMPDVIECYMAFILLFLKCHFIVMSEGMGRTGGQRTTYQVRKETINQDYANFFQVEFWKVICWMKKTGKRRSL